MASFMDDSDEATKYCAICQDTCTDPRTLPCMHTYCSKCLENLIENIRLQGESFNCPECRQICTVPQERAEELKTSFTNADNDGLPSYESCVKPDKPIPKQTEQEDKHTTGQKEYEDIQTLVRAKCLDCNSILYSKCQNDGTLSKCTQVLCHKCYPITEPGHPCADATGKAIKKGKDTKPLIKPEVCAILTLGNELINKYEQAIQDTNEYASDLDQHAENVIAEINNDMNAMIQAVRKKYKLSTEKVMNDKEYNKKRVMWHTDELQTQKSVIEGEVKKYRATVERGFPLAAKFTEELNLKSEEWSQNPKTNFNGKIHFDFTEGRYDHAGLKFGTIDARKVAIPENYDILKPLCASTFTSTKLHPCCIIDLTVTPSGNYVAVGRRTIIYDQSLKMIKDLNHKFQHVALMQDGNLAFTDCFTNRISIYDEDGDHLRDVFCRELTKLEGIHVNSSGKMLVIDSWSNQVYNIEPSTRDAKVEPPLPCKFKFARYLTTNSQQVNIVSDYAGHCVKGIAKHGTEVFNFEWWGWGKVWGRLSYPYGVCRDEGDYIFIADSNNDRVILLSPEGKFLKCILTDKDGLYHPHAVTINKDGNLLVGDFNGKLFSIKYRD